MSDAPPTSPQVRSLAPAHRRARWALGLLGLLLGVMAVALGQNPRRGMDFRVYLLAAERFLTGGALYPPSDGFMPFKYAPLTAPLFVPFTWVPARVAATLWNLGLVVALGAVVHPLSRPRPPPDAPAWPWAPVLATLVLLPALRFELFYGQVDGVLLWLLAVAALGAEKGWTWRPALAFTVALLLKPPAGLLVLFFAARRHPRVLGASVCVGLVLALPSWARYGLEGLLEQTRAWLDTLARTTPPWALGYNPQGLPTLLLSLVLPPDAWPSGRALALAQALALALFVAVLVWRRPGPRTLFALCCLGVTLLSPLAWRANFVLAWPLLLIAAEGRTRGGLVLILLAGLVGVLGADFLLGEQASIALLRWRPYALVYTALMLWAAWTRAGEPARTAHGSSLVGGTQLAK